MDDILSRNILLDDCLVRHNCGLSLRKMINIIGCSQNQIANALNIDSGSLSHMLSGDQKIPKLTLLRMCKFLKIPSLISLQLFNYNGTSIDTNNRNDSIIRGLLDNGGFNSLKKIDEAIERYNLKD